MSKASGPEPPTSGARERILVCNLGTLSAEQRTRHASATMRLLASAQRTELPEGFLFTVDRTDLSPAELAEWVADESRCCPALDFHLELPASGLLTLRIDGGIDVKAFIAAELGIEMERSADNRDRP